MPCRQMRCFFFDESVTQISASTEASLDSGRTVTRLAGAGRMLCTLHLVDGHIVARWGAELRERSFPSKDGQSDFPIVFGFNASKDEERRFLTACQSRKESTTDNGQAQSEAERIPLDYYTCCWYVLDIGGPAWAGSMVDPLTLRAGI